jgi:hypothetical protein
MTPDDMPAGPELDRMVGERVMGWKLVSGFSADSINGWGASHDGIHFARIFCGACGYDGIGEWFSPSTNIAHAWEVVERMRSLGFVPIVRGPGIYTVGDGYYKHDQWFAGFQSGATESMPIYEKEGESHADTAALAICRAALAAVESEDP